MTNPNTAPVEQVEALARLQSAVDLRADGFKRDLIRAHRSGQPLPDLADATISSLRLDDLQTVLRLAATAPLQARVEELEAVLKCISSGRSDGIKVIPLSADECRQIARAALSTTPAISRLAELEALLGSVREHLADGDVGKAIYALDQHKRPALQQKGPSDG